MRTALQQPVLAMSVRFALALRLAQLVGFGAFHRLLGFARLAFDLTALGEGGGLAVVFAGGGLVALAFVALTHRDLQFKSVGDQCRLSGLVPSSSDLA